MSGDEKKKAKGVHTHPPARGVSNDSRRRPHGTQRPTDVGREKQVALRGGAAVTTTTKRRKKKGDTLTRGRRRRRRRRRRRELKKRNKYTCLYISLLFMVDGREPLAGMMRVLLTLIGPSDIGCTREMLSHVGIIHDFLLLLPNSDSIVQEML